MDTRRYPSAEHWDQFDEYTLKEIFMRYLFKFFMRLTEENYRNQKLMLGLHLQEVFLFQEINLLYRHTKL